MSQKGRISLSHAQALAFQAPLGIEQELAQARAAAKQSPQVDLEDLIAASKQADATRESFKKLAAPPSAQKRVDGLKKKDRLGEIAGFMLPKRGKREAKAPKKLDPTSSAPTPERQAKESFGWEMSVHVGGQVSHRPKDFLETHSAHISDAGRQAAELLIAAFENAQRVQMTSARAYTGAPYTGGNPGRSRMEDMTQRQIDDAALFERSYRRLTRHTQKWWRVLRHIVLREPDVGRSQPMTPQELGAEMSAYRARDTTTANTVGWTNAALLKWLECVFEELPAGQRRSEEAQQRGKAADIEAEALYRKRIGGHR